MNTVFRNNKHAYKGLSNKKNRDAYVDSHIRNGLAFQIRGMRKSRKWSQGQLAKKIMTKQEVISRLENPDYGRFNIDTLKKLASAFDVGLMIRFVPFSELVNKMSNLSLRDIEVSSYGEDEGIHGYTEINDLRDWVGSAGIAEGIPAQITVINSSSDSSDSSTNVNYG